MSVPFFTHKRPRRPTTDTRSVSGYGTRAARLRISADANTDIIPYFFGARKGFYQLLTLILYFILYNETASFFKISNAG